MNSTASERLFFETDRAWDNQIDPAGEFSESASEDSMRLRPGPKVRVQIRQLTLSDLLNRLLEFERVHEKSTVQMISEYVTGTIAADENTERWADAFFLFLGTSEVRRFAYPTK